jgi:hypothetical protein
VKLTELKTFAMIRKSLCRLLVLSLVISCAIASEDNVDNVDESPKIDDSDKKDENVSDKTVSKRGVFHFSTHGHPQQTLVSATHYTIPQAVHKQFVPHVHAHAHVPHVHSHVPHVHATIPHVHSLPAAVPHVHAHVQPHIHTVPQVHSHVQPHFHSVPHVHSVPQLHSHIQPHFHSVPHLSSVPHVHSPAIIPAQPAFIPAPSPGFRLVPGGASVTSYSVNYPRFRQFVPAYAPPAIVPGLHHHHQHPVFAPAAPHYHSPGVIPTYAAPKPLIPVAVPFPGIRHPKYPVFINQPRPQFSGFNPQFVPFATPTPTFVPIPVPSQPQPQIPTSGMGQDSNLVPATQEFPQLHMPTPPTFVQPTMPTISSHGWRPIMMMTQHHNQHHNHHPQSTRPTFTNKYPPYNYHAPAMPLNHEPPSSSNVISGHGQMSSQLAQQLALYQQQQQYESKSHEMTK